MIRRDFIRAAVIASIGAAIAPAAFVEAVRPTPAILELSGECDMVEVVNAINASSEWQAYIVGKDGLEPVGFPCPVQFLPLKTVDMRTW